MARREGGRATVGDGGGLVEGIVGTRLRRAWWAIAMRGLVGIVLGLVALAWPGATLSALLTVLGLYLLLDGLFALVAAFRASRDERSWWPYALEGLVSMGVGVLALTHPSAVMFIVLVLVAVRCWITGFIEIATGIWLRRETGRSEWLLWLAGLVSIAFGGLLLARPGAGVLTLVWLVGLYTVTFGVIVTATAFHLKGAVRRGLTTQPS
jgi:uncharacterized membrane protein HdeD (DUF308 family)